MQGYKVYGINKVSGMDGTGSTWLLSQSDGAIVYSKKKEEGSKNKYEHPRIVIVGCGGAGCATLNRLSSIGVNGAETIAINTEEKSLDSTDADLKILIGEPLTKGLGYDFFPEFGRRAAELARRTFENVLKDVELVFITAGMGGQVGGGISPVVAEIAKEQGATVVGIVSSPYHMESNRIEKAEEGIWNLRRTSDTVIVLDNDKLSEYVPSHLSVKELFSVMDQIIAETLKDISETLTQYSNMFLDCTDIKNIMSLGGIAVMLVGEIWSTEESYDVINSIVRKTLTHPLLDVNYRSATGSFILITCGPDLTSKEAEAIASSIKYSLSPRTRVVWGTRIKRGYEGRVRVLAIMTGIRSAHILGPSKLRDDKIEKTVSKAKKETSVIDVIPF